MSKAKSQETEAKAAKVIPQSKAEIAYSLYAQAEQQLVVAVEKNAESITQLQQQLQQAQADRIALGAQLALNRKVNEKVAEIMAVSLKETEKPAVVKETVNE